MASLCKTTKIKRGNRDEKKHKVRVRKMAAKIRRLKAGGKQVA